MASRPCRVHGAKGRKVSISTYDVPGAFEMPLLARKLSQTGRYDAVVAAALVVVDQLGAGFRAALVGLLAGGRIAGVETVIDVPARVDAMHGWLLLSW